MGENSNDQPNPIDKYKENGVISGLYKLFGIVDGPVTFFKEKFIDPRREKNPYPYYHRKYNRVPSIDECNVGDYVCFYEANEQYLRDKAVDSQIHYILHKKLEECYKREGSFDGQFKCREIEGDYERALTNYHIKYGDLGATASCVDAYMKQKHRLIWQRRHPDVDLVGFYKIDEKRKQNEKVKKAIYDNPK